MSPSTRTAAPAPSRAPSAPLRLLFAALLLAAPAAAEALETVVVATAGGEEHVFRVELADTDSARRRGLMYRYSIPADGGMLFDFDEERPVTMWMRNTYIPLDMLFITGEGVIRHIEHEAQPQSLTVRSSRGPVRAVLEIRGGTARRLGIRAGDRVRHPLFEQASD